MNNLNLPSKNFEIIKIGEQEILEILCDYFLGNNPAAFEEWHANLICGEKGVEFLAIFGSSDDPVYENVKGSIFNKLSHQEDV